MAQTTKNYLDIEGLQLYDSLLKAKIASDVSASAYNDTEIKSRISSAETAIQTLNGEGDGSVKKQVSDAVAAIVSDAPDAYDTLKEISDWISSHADDASAMNSQIQTNKNSIASLTALIGELPEGAASETIVAYIAEAIGASKTELTGSIATAKSEAISEAKSYADSLSSNYATADQGAKADTALQKADITSGSANGTIAVDGTDVPVKGLNSAAYKAAGSASGNVPVNGSDLGTTANVPVVTNASGELIPHAGGALGTAAFAESTDFDAAGTAQTKVAALENGQVAANKTNIETLQSKVEALESVQYVAISTEQINSLFTS